MGSNGEREEAQAVALDTGNDTSSVANHTCGMVRASLRSEIQGTNLSDPLCLAYGGPVSVKRDG